MSITPDNLTTDPRAQTKEDQLQLQRQQTTAALCSRLNAHLSNFNPSPCLSVGLYHHDPGPPLTVAYWLGRPRRRPGCRCQHCPTQHSLEVAGAPPVVYPSFPLPPPSSSVTWHTALVPATRAAGTQSQTTVINIPSIVTSLNETTVSFLAFTVYSVYLSPTDLNTERNKIRQTDRKVPEDLSRRDLSNIRRPSNL